MADKRTHNDGTDTDRHPKLWAAAAGMGIGSAALVAALLYSNRGKKTAPVVSPPPTPRPPSSAVGSEAGPGEFGE